MKIARVFHGNHWVLGAVKNSKILAFEQGKSLVDLMETGGRLQVREESPVDLEDVRWAPVVQGPGKIIAIGLNYRDHAAEGKREIPDFPIIFAKFPSSLLGHLERITWEQQVTRKVDFEAELAVIIGRKVRNCPEEEALDAVFGYTCANDVSARDLQFRDRQLVRGKSLDTFCPLGPWLVTRDEIPDPQNLGIRCRVNDELMQDSRTSEMIFPVSRLISLLSRHFTLFPGDIILSGTPAGVGAFRQPPIYLRDGDKVVVEIDGIGRLENTCRVVETG